MPIDNSYLDNEDRDYERGVANGDDMTQGFYPDWDGNPNPDWDSDVNYAEIVPLVNDADYAVDPVELERTAIFDALTDAGLV
jgi:hypothetical protein